MKNKAYFIPNDARIFPLIFFLFPNYIPQSIYILQQKPRAPHYNLRYKQSPDLYNPSAPSSRNIFPSQRNARYEKKREGKSERKKKPRFLRAAHSRQKPTAGAFVARFSPLKRRRRRFYRKLQPRACRATTRIDDATRACGCGNYYRGEYFSRRS